MKSRWLLAVLILACSKRGPDTSSGTPSERAAKAIAACSPAPPKACREDTDCTIIDLETSDNPCASTLRVGVTSSQVASYVAKSPCPKRASEGPSCVVHWVRAEDGPDPPPSGAHIVARCVRSSCLTQYVSASP